LKKRVIEAEEKTNVISSCDDKLVGRSPLYRHVRQRTITCLASFDVSAACCWRQRWRYRCN